MPAAAFTVVREQLDELDYADRSMNIRIFCATHAAGDALKPAGRIRCFWSDRLVAAPGRDRYFLLIMEAAIAPAVRSLGPLMLPVDGYLMASHAPLKLLYVDDEPDLMAVVVRAFKFDGQIDVVTADSGLAALAILEDEAQRPDVVLLDVMMPDLDGPGTLRRMNRLPGPPIPVIFFTARAQNSELHALADQGAIGILTKPFDPLTLASQIRHLLAQWQSSRS